jgi:hypothetical protein
MAPCQFHLRWPFIEKLSAVRVVAFHLHAKTSAWGVIVGLLPAFLSTGRKLGIEVDLELKRQAGNS